VGVSVGALVDNAMGASVGASVHLSTPTSLH
jgi:hypothetical protein